MKNKKIDYDGFTSIIVLFVGLIYLAMSMSLPKAAIGNAMDPIYFPLGLSVILILISLLLFIRSDKSQFMRIIDEMKNQSPKDKEVTKMVFLTCATAIGYGLIFEHLGFILSTFLFMMSILFLTNGKKILVNTLVAGIFSISIFALFNYALGIPLPGLPFI